MLAPRGRLIDAPGGCALGRGAPVVRNRKGGDEKGLGRIRIPSLSFPNLDPDHRRGTAGGAADAQPWPSTAPTLADLQVLYDGRDQLLRVVEVAEYLGVCNATVYRLCERGELRHVWIVNSIRIRPADLKAFLDWQSLGRGEPEPRD